MDELPPRATPTRGDDRAVAARLALCFFVFYAAFAPGNFKSSDEWTVFEATASWWDRGTPSVMPAPYTHRGKADRLYSQYALGQSVLALPFFWAGRIAGNTLPEPWVDALAGRRIPPKGRIRAGGTPEMAAVSLFAPLVTALLVAVCFLLQRSVGTSLGAALLASTLIGASTYVAMQVGYFLRHATTTLLLLGALLAFQRYRESGRSGALLWGALLASWIPLVRLPDALLGLPLGLWLMWLLRDAFRREGWPALRRALPALGVPAVLAVAAHLASNQLRWGTWIETPILSYAADFSFPILDGLRGFLLSPGASVFAYSPLLLLVPWTAPALWRRDRALLCFCLGTSLGLLLFYSRWEYWPGLPTCPGPRYLYAAVPLLLLSLGPWLDARRGRALRAAFVGLAAGGALIQLALLLANWHMIIRELQIAGAQPPWPWVLVPEKSPIVGAFQAVGIGELNPWLWRLAQGWTGHPARPGAAAVLLGVWGGTLGLAIAWLLRRVRVAEGR